MRKSVEGKRSSSEYRPSEFEELAAKSRGARRDSQKRNRLSAGMVRFASVCAHPRRARSARDSTVPSRRLTAPYALLHAKRLAPREKSSIW